MGIKIENWILKNCKIIFVLRLLASEERLGCGAGEEKLARRRRSTFEFPKLLKSVGEIDSCTQLAILWLYRMSRKDLLFDLGLNFRSLFRVVVVFSVVSNKD